MIGFLRGNVGLLVWLGIFLIGAVVLTIGGYLMHARGLSLKPVWWFAGFMLLIGFPQLAYHTIVAISSPYSSIPPSPATVPTTAGIDNPETLFTVTPEGATVVDIPPQAASGVLGRSEAGRLLTMPNGDTVMIARFRSGAESERAVGDYLRESGLESSARPDAEGGFTIPGNDRRFARVYARNSILIVHTTVSYAYTFDLQEMKSPLIESVTQAGWRWQPVAWQGPVWLRWLTE